MYTYLLFTIYLAISPLSIILSKKLQLGMAKTYIHHLLYNLYNALFASVCFYFICGFKMEMNQITFFYSAIFAIIVVLSLVSGIIILEHVSVSLSTVIKSSGSIILTVLAGHIFFNESFSLRTAVAVICILSAVIIPCSNLLNAKGGIATILICALTFFISSLGNILLKFYAISPFVLDENYMFLMTNLLLFAVCLVLLFIHIIKYKKTISSVNLKPKQIMRIGTMTALSNLGSILSLLILAKMPVSVFTISTSAVSLIGSAAVSKFYFKEPLSKSNIISVLFALLAVFLMN